jgi:hypothetical protein
LVHHPLFFILRTHPLRQSAVSLFWLEDPRAGSPASLAWSFDCEDIVCQSFSLLCPAYASTLCECSHRHRILAIISWHDSAYRYPVLTRKRYVYLRAGIILLHTHRSLVLPPPPILNPGVGTEHTFTYACSIYRFQSFSFEVAVRIPPPFAQACSFTTRSQHCSLGTNPILILAWVWSTSSHLYAQFNLS